MPSSAVALFAASQAASSDDSAATPACSKHLTGCHSSEQTCCCMPQTTLYMQLKFGGISRSCDCAGVYEASSAVDHLSANQAGSKYKPAATSVSRRHLSGDSSLGIHIQTFRHNNRPFCMQQFAAKYDAPLYVILLYLSMSCLLVSFHDPARCRKQ